MQGITRYPGVRYPVLVPNERGLDRALDAGVDDIALFTAATDAFAQANVGTTIEGTFERFAPVIERAKTQGVWVRGYVSVAFGCPYSGSVSPGAVAGVTEQLLAAGCDEDLPGRHYRKWHFRRRYRCTRCRQRINDTE